MAASSVSGDSAAAQLSGSQWHDTLLERMQRAGTADERISVMELCRTAVEQETGDVKLWRLYGDWVWMLYKISHKVKGIYPTCSLEHVDIRQEWDEEDNLIGQAVFQWGRILDIWEEAVRATKWHINESHLIWDTYAELLVYDLSQSKGPEKLAEVYEAFTARLHQPHATWDNTFQNFSQFVTTYDVENYERKMTETKAKTQKARSEYEVRERREIMLAQAARAGDEQEEIRLAQEYLIWEESQMKRKKNVPPYARELYLALCERFVTRFPSDPEFWIDYVLSLNQEPRDTQALLSVAQKGTAHCPASGELWGLRMYVSEACDKTFAEIEDVKHSATKTDKLQESGRMEEQIKVDYAWCSYLRRRAFTPQAQEEDLDVAEMAIRSSIDEMMADGAQVYGKNFKGDPQFRLERVYLKFLAQCGRLQEGRQLFRQLEKSHGDASYFWERWYLWEMTTYGSPSDLNTRTPSGPLSHPSSATAALERALKRPNIDWPEKIVEMYLHHCGQHESVHKLLEAITETRKVMRQVTKLREKQMAETAAQQEPHQPAQPAKENAPSDEASEARVKRKRDVNSEDATPKKRARGEPEHQTQHQETQQSVASSSATAQVKRDREHTTVVVRHLPVDADEGSVRQFFRDCGEVLSLNLVSDERKSESTATIEFSTKDDVSTAVTKDRKVFGGNEINVEVGTGTTLFVSNYPPSADEKYIRGLFADYGEVVEVRFPSLKFDAHRRFCYVQFVTVAQAYAATSLDGTTLSGGLVLTAKISNPAAKKDRSGPIEDGRELYVRNVNWSANEQDVKDLFGRFGQIESVHIPRNLNGKSKGVAFVTFVAKDQADKALEMNLKDYRNRVLEVSIAAPHGGSKRTATVTVRNVTSASPQPVAEDTEMANTPDTNASSAAAHPSTHFTQRTLALLDLPDTMNAARVRSLCEPYGALVKVQLRPDHAGALVEFENVADVGRAGMALDGHEIAKGAKIRIGTAKELFNSKPQKAASRAGGPAKPLGLQPARPVNRPGQAAKRGGRGGLGFRANAAARVAAEEPAENGGGDAGAPAAPAQSKTQADFRAMLSGSSAAKPAAPNGDAEPRANGSG